MTAYIQTVVTAPVVGREDEFNRWYEDTHLPEVLQVPGFVAGRRYALTGPGAADGPRFLAVYEIETDDLAAPFPEPPADHHRIHIAPIGGMNHAP